MEIEIIAAFFQWFLKQQVNFQFYFKTDTWKSGGWQSYRATTGNERQTWIWFEDNFKGFRVHIEILATAFGGVSKQQLIMSLFL